MPTQEIPISSLYRIESYHELKRFGHCIGTLRGNQFNLEVINKKMQAIALEKGLIKPMVYIYLDFKPWKVPPNENRYQILSYSINATNNSTINLTQEKLDTIRNNVIHGTFTFQPEVFIVDRAEYY